MKLRQLSLLICALLLPVSAQAETYRVDLIVFLDKSAASEQGRRPVLPNMSRALELENLGALKAAGITLLPDAQFGLNEEWQRIKNAKRYQPVIRLAWLQKDPPAERGTALHLQWRGALKDSDADGISPVDGTVSLLAGHFLHLDTDLLYTQSLAEGGQVSYRLRENRLMRRDELHHLDSPKLGLLARITKADGG